MTKVNIEDNYYHGWFNGKDESDDSAYIYGLQIKKPLIPISNL